MTNPRDLYTVHVDFVWRSLRRLGVPESDVADSAQEVFLVAFRRMEEFEGRAKWSTWLYRICLRVAADRRRLAHVRREIPHEDGDLELLLPPVRDQRAELEVLDFEQRAVFTRFELEGFTGPEIAELVEVPLATIYSRLRLARADFAQRARRIRARELRSSHEVSR
ncbi:MAG: RNA polymerase sigma factor [Polyangiaceae bacterium]|nr:RNA polymerase sigma factor [Polyangiaceae bacterium]